jgi:hypothetical protein
MKQDELGRSLLEAFARVPDQRAARGRRHPLPAMLALATAAMLAGARSLYAIAQWGRAQPLEVVSALGFTRAQTPAVATLHYTFKALDAVAFEEALAQWAGGVADGGVADGGVADGGVVPLVPLALDGKGLRGLHGEELPGVRLVALYDVRAGVVRAQKGGQDPR